jgi:hypothetical protein
LFFISNNNIFILGNEIGDKGMKYLSESFQYLSSLQVLNISGNLINILKLFSIYDNDIFIFLGNEIGNEGMKNISQYLQSRFLK